MTDLLTPTTLLCMGAVMIGAMVQGFSGIGFALFAAPLVGLVRPELIPGPMLVLGGTVSLLAAAREFRRIDFRAAGIAFAGRIPGSILAGLVVGLVPKHAFGLLFGLLILSAAAVSIAVGRIEPQPRYLGLAGFVSGFMGTITAVGTPPMGLVMQSVEPGRLRATIGVFLVAGGIVSIAVLAVAGRFHWHDFTLSLALLPAMAAGFALSSLLVGRFTPATVRYAVLAVSAVSALILVGRSLLG